MVEKYLAVNFMKFVDSHLLIVTLSLTCCLCDCAPFMLLVTVLDDNAADAMVRTDCS